MYLLAYPKQRHVLYRNEESKKNCRLISRTYTTAQRKYKAGTGSSVSIPPKEEEHLHLFPIQSSLVPAE